MKRFVIAGVVLVSTLSAILWWQLGKQRAIAEAPAGGSGTIEGTRVAVAPMLAARIVAVHVEEGDRVEAGQALVELDCTEPRARLAEANAAVAAAAAGQTAAQAGLRAAQLAVQAAETRVVAAKAGERGARAKQRGIGVQRETASRTAGRVETLHTGGRASARQLDDAKTRARALRAEQDAVKAGVEGARAQRSTAEVAVDAARAQVELAKAKLEGVVQDGRRAATAVTRAQALVAECVLRAPEAGIVQTRAAEPGEVARPGLPILTLIDARQVTATFYLPNAELAVAQPGRAVSVVADAWPDRRWTGQIARVSAEAEFTPRNVQTRQDRDRLVYAVDVRLANDDGALRPGMPVEVTLDDDR